MTFKNNHTGCMSRGNSYPRACLHPSQFVVAYKSGPRKGRKIPMCRPGAEAEKSSSHVKSVTTIDA